MTAWEVIKYGTLSDKFPSGRVQPYIAVQEGVFKRKFFGDLYDLMLADLIDYGVLKEWDSENTYGQGNRVLWDETVLESLKDGNVINPCEDNGDCWVIAKKFNNDCYNQLWNTLSVTLALFITPYVLKGTMFDVSGKGSTKYYNNDTGIRTIEIAESREQKSDALNLAHESLENTKDWMRKSSCVFSAAQFLIDEGCAQKEETFLKSPRRIYMKRK